MLSLAWIVLGLMVGYIGSMLVNKRGERPLINIVIGMLGAFFGGFLFSTLGARGVNGFSFYSLFVAVAGSVVFLLIYQTLFRRERV